MRNTLPFAVVAAIVLGLAGTLVAFRSVALSPQQGHGTEVQPSVDKPFNATKIFQLTNGCTADFSISLLKAVTLADGSVVRPLSARVRYELPGHRFLGQASIHKLCAADSTETLDLSAKGLDMNLYNPDPASLEVLTNFTARVSLATGLRWSQVRSFKDDLIVITGVQ